MPVLLMAAAGSGAPPGSLPGVETADRTDMLLAAGCGGYD